MKLQSKILKDITSTNLPSNIKNFKQKLLSGKRFAVYR